MVKKSLKRVISLNDSARLSATIGDGLLLRMGAQGGSATNVVQLNASGRGEAKIVAAARVLSIDYRSIVENAVGSLADNNPDMRGKVYAQARSVVKRHLQLMRLPEPIVELEKLALDLTVKKIERQWRAREAAKKAVPDDPPGRRIKRNRTRQARGSPAKPPAAPGTTLWSLRPKMNPIRVAMALPIVATAIFFIFFDNVVYRSLVDGPAGQWLSGLNVESSVPAPGAAPPSRSRRRALIAVPPGSARSASNLPRLPAHPRRRRFQRLAAVDCRFPGASHVRMTPGAATRRPNHHRNRILSPLGLRASRRSAMSPRGGHPRRRRPPRHRGHARMSGSHCPKRRHMARRN